MGGRKKDDGWEEEIHSPILADPIRLLTVYADAIRVLNVCARRLVFFEGLVKLDLPDNRGAVLVAAQDLELVSCLHSHCLEAIRVEVLRLTGAGVNASETSEH